MIEKRALKGKGEIGVLECRTADGQPTGRLSTRRQSVLRRKNAMENSTERHENRLAKPGIAQKRGFSVPSLVHESKGFADGLMQSHEWSCLDGI